MGCKTPIVSTQGHYANSVGELTSEHEPYDESYVIVMLTNSAGYIVAAAPRSFGKTGRRTFYMYQTGKIYNRWDPEPASLQDPQIGQF